MSGHEGPQPGQNAGDGKLPEGCGQRSGASALHLLKGQLGPCGGQVRQEVRRSGLGRGVQRRSTRPSVGRGREDREESGSRLCRSSQARAGYCAPLCSLAGCGRSWRGWRWGLDQGSEGRQPKNLGPGT